MTRVSSYQFTLPVKDGKIQEEYRYRYDDLKEEIRKRNEFRKILNKEYEGEDELKKLYIVKKPRLGRNNPAARKYKTKWNGYQMIRMADAVACDIYVYERDWR